MPTLSSADPVLETQVFWFRHKKEVFALLILALLSVAAWGGYRFYSERREATAANSLQSQIWLTIVPSVMIFITVFTFNQLGEGLREAFDAETRG